MLISGNGGQDFFSNAVSSSAAPNIGAYNGSGARADNYLANVQQFIAFSQEVQ